MWVTLEGVFTLEFREVISGTAGEQRWLWGEELCDSQLNPDTILFIPKMKLLDAFYNWLRRFVNVIRPIRRRWA
jgi:hypothetical protein